MARVIDKNDAWTRNVPNFGTLTNSTGVTPAVNTANATIQNVGATFNQATLNQNFAEITAKLNALLAERNTEV